MSAERPILIVDDDEVLRDIESGARLRLHDSGHLPTTDKLLYHGVELLKLRHPNSMLMQVWCEDARHVLGDVTTDATLFLGHTAPVNDAATCGPRSRDAANS